ncbi:hypothetical protein AALP_AA7G235400 [Arabis alpina]|uniref:BHLH domain-containing protein n=1 Tax=Arabis alpina TaxID=50452 RepID=A0A087GK36_ARAAL|nr:hypothetical protein AALP_AA7G235400 [Arabis alpina]
MDQSKKPKICSESDYVLDSSASSSSSGHNLRHEMVMEVKKEPVASTCRKILKADREKIRRDKLNEQFLELGNALDPNRPKSDKTSILNDTIQILKDLMSQVDRLKAEYVTLSKESYELMQEKRELREEKVTLKSDIEILNGQYQDRVRKTMVPWIPHYTYPLPVVAITQAPIAVPPQLQPFPFYGTQDTKPCSTIIHHSSSSSGASNKQDSKSKSLDLNLMRKSNHTYNKDDVGLELELKIYASSSAQKDEKKGGSSKTIASSSNYSSSQADSKIVPSVP